MILVYRGTGWCIPQDSPTKKVRQEVMGRTVVSSTLAKTANSDLRKVQVVGTSSCTMYNVHITSNVDIALHVVAQISFKC